MVRGGAQRGAGQCRHRGETDHLPMLESGEAEGCPEVSVRLTKRPFD
jgi:hypothetical protein